MNKKWFRALYISSLISGVLWWTPESQILNPSINGEYSKGLPYVFGQGGFYIGILIAVASCIFLIKRIEVKNARTITKTIIVIILTIALAFIVGAILGLYTLSPRMYW